LVIFVYFNFILYYLISLSFLNILLVTIFIFPPTGIFYSLLGTYDELPTVLQHSRDY